MRAVTTRSWRWWGSGEGNHHNHHAFPRSARHGLQPWELDPTWWLIWTMEKTGLAWDVQRVTPEALEAKRARPLEQPVVSQDPVLSTVP